MTLYPQEKDDTNHSTALNPTQRVPMDGVILTDGLLSQLRLLPSPVLSPRQRPFQQMWERYGVRD